MLDVQRPGASAGSSRMSAGAPGTETTVGTAPNSSSGQSSLAGFDSCPIPLSGGHVGGCWALILPGETSPQLQVVHAPVAPERRGGGEVTSPYPHCRFWPGSAHIPCFCVLAAIPFPSRAFLRGGEVAGFGRGFAPCSVWTPCCAHRPRSGCKLPISCTSS